MKKLFLLPAAAAAIGLAVYSTAFAHMSGQGWGMMDMMGGGCPMMGMMGGGMMGHDMMGQGMMGQNMMGQGMMGGSSMRIGAMAEARLAFLKSALEITDSQAEAWNAYAEAVKARAATMQDMHSGMMGMVQKGTATERMDAHLKAMQAMVEGMGALKPATEKLYGVLMPEQKKVADDLLGMGCCAM